jgi:uncharacterized protein (TIGR02246 family)
MNALPLSVLFVSILSAVALPAAAQQSDADAIRDLEVRQADAWNRHDAAAYANLFSDDGDVVNVFGWYWKSPGETKSKLDDAFAFVFRDSTLTITDVQIRFLHPTIAVVHVWWTLDGAKTPPGAPAPPRHGVQLQVLTKQSGRWQIASFQNTNSIPEMPFPRAPAGAKP